MSLLHASVHRLGLEGLFVNAAVVNSEQARGARGAAGSPSLCVDGADLLPEAPGGPSCRVYRSVDGRRRGLPDRQALVDRLHHVAQGG